MRDASKVLILAVAIMTVGGCHRQPQVNASANDDLSIEDNLSSNQDAGNMDVETLPPDESDTTSSGELNKGNDNPDVNDLGNSD
jgi:hypothetical protein